MKTPLPDAAPGRSAITNTLQEHIEEIKLTSVVCIEI